MPPPPQPLQAPALRPQQRPALPVLPAAQQPAAAAAVGVGVGVDPADTAGNVTVDGEPSLSPCTTMGREFTLGRSQVEKYLLAASINM